jgi:hypothetical protein
MRERTMTITQQLIQNAYVVNDIDEAIERWHALWGIGPFFVRRHIVMSHVLYRGAPSQIDISAVYVQAGPIQVELVQQHCNAPSAFRDMYPAGTEGFHHVAVLPQDHQQLLDHYAALGFVVATEIRTAGGRGAAYVDTRAMLGHMTEVYMPGEGIETLYRMVAEASARWDRRQLTIELEPT